jgi:hypothetical protein
VNAAHTSVGAEVGCTLGSSEVGSSVGDLEGNDLVGLIEGTFVGSEAVGSSVGEGVITRSAEHSNSHLVAGSADASKYDDHRETDSKLSASMSA